MKSVRLMCAPRLIEELPRMFGGMKSILKELFQNSYRCGATTLVEVEWNQDTHVLVFRDNGTGIADPQTLVTAGSTGWDKQRVIDPAGIGVFSLLNDHICAQVEINSYSKDISWRMVLSPEVLKTKVVQYENLSPPKDTGLELTITLLPGVKVDKDMIKVARALYPYKVLWTYGDEKPIEISPRKYINPVITLETEVGQIKWSPFAGGGITSKAIWEYCLIESMVFSSALINAAGDHRYERLALAIAGGNLKWHIDPAGKVRPRLPDRSELIDDTNLEKAASVILDTLINEVIVRFKSVSESWPSLIKPSMFSNELKESLGDNKWLVTRNLASHLMEMKGWKTVKAEDPGHLVIWFVEDYGFDSTGEDIVLYDRNALEMSDPSVVYTLVNQGKNISYDKTANTEVKLHGLRLSPELPRTECEKKNNAAARLTSPLVKLVDRIEVKGYGDIPFLIRESDDPWVLTEVVGTERWDSTVIVFAGSASEFIVALKETPLFSEAVTLFAYNTGTLEDWDWWRWSEGYVDHQKIEDDLVKQVAETYDPELLTVSRGYFASRDSSQNLLAAIQQLKIASSRIRTANYWHAKVFSACLHLLQQAVSKLKDWLDKDQDKAGHSAGLK